MLFLLLCDAAPAMCDTSCNEPSSLRLKWIGIDSQILSGLFCILGHGLAPWRMRDLYLWISAGGREGTTLHMLVYAVSIGRGLIVGPKDLGCKGASIVQVTLDVSARSTSPSS